MRPLLKWEGGKGVTPLKRTGHELGIPRWDRFRCWEPVFGLGGGMGLGPQMGARKYIFELILIEINFVLGFGRGRPGRGAQEIHVRIYFN